MESSRSQRQDPYGQSQVRPGEALTVQGALKIGPWGGVLVRVTFNWAGLQFQRLSSLSSRQHPGRHDTGGAECSVS